ncbi:MAG: DUF1450 domain-containing protein [Campylobacterota bacterium]|nr:DUF1450 domain-containing protein [Campylobacterota bacterium]
MKIKICKKFSKTKKFHKKLTKAFPDDDIIIKSCISMCKTCKKQAVAKVDGAKMKGRNIRKIIGKMKNL